MLGSHTNDCQVSASFSKLYFFILFVYWWPEFLIQASSKIATINIIKNYKSKNCLIPSLLTIGYGGGVVGDGVQVDGGGVVVTAGVMVVDDGRAVTSCKFKCAFLDFLIALFTKSILRLNLFTSLRSSLGSAFCSSLNTASQSALLQIFYSCHWSLYFWNKKNDNLRICAVYHF